MRTNDLDKFSDLLSSEFLKKIQGMTSLRRVILVLLACGAMALPGCDQRDDDDHSSARSDEHAGNILSLSPYTELKPTWAGSYLASRVAQDRFDWGRAGAFLEQVQSERNSNPVMDRRLMLLSMGSGHFDQALKQARQIDAAQDESGLTGLILLLAPIRDGQFITAENLLEQIPKSTLSKFIYPLVSVWLGAARGQTDLSPLAGNRSYYYHRVLLADFLNAIDGVANKEILLGVNDQLTAISAERIGDIFLRHQKYDLAATLYKTTQILNPNIPGLMEKMAAAENQTAPLPDTINLSPPVASATEGIAYAFFDMAMSFYNEQSLESAQLFAQMALVLKPDLAESHLLLGNLLYRNGRIDAAIETYNMIPADNPRYRAVHQQIAQLLVQQNRNDDAITALKKLIDGGAPADQIDYLMQIGDIYRDQEDFSYALDYYNMAARKIGDPIPARYWQLLYARGMTLERLKKWTAAEDDLRAALVFQPNHAHLLNYLGYSWADQGLHLPEATDMLIKAATLAPHDGYITDSLGWVYFKTNQYPKAVEHLERAVELMPYDPTINDHLGDAYARVGRKREAEFQWHRAYNYTEDDEQKNTIGAKLGLITLSN